jgi:hypothetical protein
MARARPWREFSSSRRDFRRAAGGRFAWHLARAAGKKTFPPLEKALTLFFLSRIVSAEKGGDSAMAKKAAKKAVKKTTKKTTKKGK